MYFVEPSNWEEGPGQFMVSIIPRSQQLSSFPQLPWGQGNLLLPSTMYPLSNDYLAIKVIRKLMYNFHRYHWKGWDNFAQLFTIFPTIKDNAISYQQAHLSRHFIWSTKNAMITKCQNPRAMRMSFAQVLLQVLRPVSVPVKQMLVAAFRNIWQPKYGSYWTISIFIAATIPKPLN